MAQTYITVNAWGSPPQVYPKTAQSIQLSCNHTKIGVYLITTTLQVLPLPGDTELMSEGGQGTETYPVQKFANLNAFPQEDGVKKVVLVLDHTTNVQYYVDYTSYNNNVANCNPLPYVTACSAPTSLSAGTITTSSAIMSFTGVAGASGYEWVNSTADEEPSVPGTFASASPISVTDLTTDTDYYFFIRTICIGGSTSDWVRVHYTTA